MSAVTIETEFQQRVGILEYVKTRVDTELVSAVKLWRENVQRLNDFQNEKMICFPTTESITAHKINLLLMISIGEWLERSTSNPDFPDRDANETVIATLQMLRDDLALWHGNQNTPQQSAVILAACFPA